MDNNKEVAMTRHVYTVFVPVLSGVHNVSSASRAILKKNRNASWSHETLKEVFYFLLLL